ncbi:VOC family protein [Streptomyces sp. KL116D]|uniref:VOC family protein n=1 Tax=Streptomyces sp. KL116D TaxID=3045152 RepID=UPI003556F18B
MPISPITLTSVIIDAADIETEGAFWHRLLGGSVHRTPTHHFIQAPGLPVVVVQSAPGHVAPSWPDGTSQQMHLDFGVQDLATADRTATEAGAIRLRPTEESTPEGPTGSRVYASPAGHPFCLRAA